MSDSYWQKVGAEAERGRLFYIKKMASLVSNQRSKPVRKRRAERRKKG